MSERTVFGPILDVCGRVHHKRLGEIKAQVKLAHEVGIRFACGGGTGPSPHGQDVREMELMIDAGLPVQDVLEACFIGSWEACGGDLRGMRFGWFEKGFQSRFRHSMFFAVRFPSSGSCHNVRAECD